MELSINALAEREAAFLGRMAQGRWAPSEHKRPDTTRPAQGERDQYDQLRELAESAKTGEETKAATQRLLRHFAWAYRIRTAAEALFAVADAAAEPIVSSMQSMPLAEALHRIPDDAVRDRRHALERDAAQALWDRQSPWAQTADAFIRANAQLGLTPDVPKEWLEAAETFLLKTEDAYRDLLAYALKRIAPELKPRHARWHDVQHATSAPWMRDVFGENDLGHAATRTFEELGLQPARVRIEDRAATDVFVIEAPGDVRVGFRRRNGMPAMRELLEAMGEALQWAHARTEDPVSARRFPHPAHVAATRALTGNFVLEEGWLKRFLRLPSAAAREAARMGALHALTQLREAAAVLPYQLELNRRGPSRGLADEFEDRLSRALLAGVPKGLYLQRVVEGVEPVLLEAASLEVALGASLRERFNEDYFRNPAAGAWFKERAGTLGTAPFDPIAPAPALALAGQRLVRLMGA